MIAFLSGPVLAFRKDCAIVKSGDVGYQVFLTQIALARLSGHPGQASYWIYEHIREDSHTLFGFNTLPELEGFEALLSVRGLGPKLALKALSSATFEQIVKLAKAGDVDGLCELDGIGARTAEALCEEFS